MNVGVRRTWLVARREWTQRVRTKAFRISTVLSVLLIVAIIVLPEALGADRAPTRTVGLVGESPPELPALLRAGGRAFDLTVETRTFASGSAGREAVLRGDVTVLLVDGRELVWRSEPDDQLAAIVTAAVRTVRQQALVAELGLTEDQAEALLRPPELASGSLEPVTEERAARIALATVAVILLFLAINLYGGFLLVGVIEEKSSRVVEVLLSRVRPSELMAGKIAGIGAVGLAQFAAIAIGAVVALRLSGTTLAPQTTTTTIAWIVLWFVLGYAFYSVLYAAAGSMVSRQEEAQTLAFPISAVMLVGYIAAFAILENPDSPGAVIGSLIPPSAPMFMIVRIASGGVPWWQMALAIALMVGSIVGMVVLAARIYTGALLRVGRRVKLAEAWRGGRM